MMRRAPANGTSEQSINDLVSQLEMLNGHLYTHSSMMRGMLERMPSPRKPRQKVDYYRGTAGPDNPTATALSLTFNLGWIPALAEISTVLIGVGGAAAATLQIGKRVWTPINVAANIPNPQTLPLAEDGGIIVYPQDVIKLSVPTTPVVLYLELIGHLLDLEESVQVFQ